MSPIDIITRFPGIERKISTKAPLCLQSTLSYIYTTFGAYTRIRIASGFIVPTADITRSFHLSYCISLTAADTHDLLEALLCTSRQKRPQQSVTLTGFLQHFRGSSYSRSAWITTMQLEIDAAHSSAVVQAMQSHCNEHLGTVAFEGPVKGMLLRKLDIKWLSVHLFHWLKVILRNWQSHTVKSVSGVLNFHHLSIITILPWWVPISTALATSEKCWDNSSSSLPQLCLHEHLLPQAWLAR